MNITTPSFVLEIIHQFQQANYEIYIVGGAVRDLMTQKTLMDWDFTTNATPEEILHIFPNAFYDNQYGTVKVVNPEDKIKHQQGQLDTIPVYEITTYRKEFGYSNQRHPDKIEWGKTLEEDLERRDFTINAMALKPEKNTNPKSRNSNFKLIDIYQGQQDLQARTIRAVGDPATRFQEDALRLMRAVRFASQLGFSIEINTLNQIQQNASLIKKISKERIRDELLKLLTKKYAADGIRILASTGLMEYIIPELINTQGVEQGGHHTDDVWEHSIKSLQHCRNTDPIVRLATLIHDIGKPYTRAHICSNCGYRFKENIIKNNEPSQPQTNTKTPNKRSYLSCPKCNHPNNYRQTVTFYNHEMAGAKIASRIADRLRLSNKQKYQLITLVRWHMFSVDERQTDKAIRRFIRNVTKPYLQDMLDLRTADRLGGGARETSWRYEKFKNKLIEVQKQPFTVHDLKITGNDIMKKLKIKPGPYIGQILNDLYQQVVDKQIENNRETLLQQLARLAPQPKH